MAANQVTLPLVASSDIIVHLPVPHPQVTDNYADFFGKRNKSTVRTIVSNIIICLIVILSSIDFIFNICTSIYLPGGLKYFFVIVWVLTIFPQWYYFIKTNIDPKWFISQIPRRTSSELVRMIPWIVLYFICAISGIGWSFVIMIQYTRELNQNNNNNNNYNYNRITNTDINCSKDDNNHNNKTNSIINDIYEQQHLKWIITSNINHHKHEYLRNIALKLQGFIFRTMTETTVLATIIILCAIGNEKIMDDDNSDKENNSPSVVFYCILFKLLIILIVYFFFVMNWSSGLDIYTHLTDSFAWMSDITRSLFLTILMLKIIFRGNNDKNNEYYSFLFAIYFYPCVLFLLIGVSLFWFFIFKNAMFAWAQNHNIRYLNVNRTFNIIFWTLSPFIFIISLTWAEFCIYCVCEWALLSIFSDSIQKLDDGRFPHRKYQPNILQNKQYKGVYYLFNKICYYLLFDDININNINNINSINTNTTTRRRRISDRARMYQKMGCVNYEILEYCNMKAAVLNHQYRRVRHYHSHKNSTNIVNDTEKNDTDTIEDETKFDSDNNGINNNNNNNNNNDTNNLKDEYIDSGGDNRTSMKRETISPVDAFVCRLQNSQQGHLMKDLEITDFLNDNKINVNTSDILACFYKIYKAVFLIDIYHELKETINLNMFNDFMQIDTPKKEKVFKFLLVFVILTRFHLVLIPIYSCICFISSSTNDTNNKMLDLNKHLDVLLFILMISSIILFFIFLFYLCVCLIPLYYQLSFVLPFAKLCGIDDIDANNRQQVSCLTVKKSFELVDIQVCQQLFESILLHMKALESRPIKEQIIWDYFGKDIGSIVIKYLPICDYKECLRDGLATRNDIVEYDPLTHYLNTNWYETY